jgi:hypothetical protein
VPVPDMTPAVRLSTRRRMAAMLNRTTTLQWMGAALVGALAVVTVIGLAPTSADRLGVALRATARWSYLWFWLSYCGGTLATLFGTAFQPVARRARDFGLGFASAHLVHLTVVARYLHVSVKPFPRSSLVIFSVAAFLIYLLALMSVPFVSAKMNPRVIRTVRTVGVEYIALTFLVEFSRNSIESGEFDVAYVPFIILAAAGPPLRIWAMIKKRNAVRRVARGLGPI